jgi:hypothetical protein
MSSAFVCGADGCNADATPRAIGVLFGKVHRAMEMIAISRERVAVGAGVSGRDARLRAIEKQFSYPVDTASNLT